MKMVPDPASTTKAETMNDEHWTPNKDYHLQATWPPYTHPLSSLFHNARLQWPTNMDSRFQYERLVDWLATHLPASPEGREAEKGEAERLMAAPIFEAVGNWLEGPCDSAEELKEAVAKALLGAKVIDTTSLEDRHIEELRTHAEKLRWQMTHDERPVPPHGWTCFHCAQAFTTWASASAHFGDDPRAGRPECCIASASVPGEVERLVAVENFRVKVASLLEMTEEEWAYLKAIMPSEIEQLRRWVHSASPAPTEVEKLRAGATEAMIEAGMKVDMAGEDERAVLHNIWNAMQSAALAPTPASAEPAASVPGEVEKLRTAANQAWHYLQSPESYSAEEKSYVFDCLDEALAPTPHLCQAVNPEQPLAHDALAPRQSPRE